VDLLTGIQSKRRAIGEEVMRQLHELDQVAYVRFASVYREFKDVNQFMSELKDLLKTKEGTTSAAKTKTH